LAASSCTVKRPEAVLLLLPLKAEEVLAGLVGAQNQRDHQR